MLLKAKNNHKSTVFDGTFKNVGGTNLMVRSGFVPQWCKTGHVM